MQATSRAYAVIIVEDSDEDFDTVVQAVRKAGILTDLRRAKSGGECLDLLRSAPDLRPALMLMDLNTPGTDGREALVAIKQHETFKLFPVVVFSTSDDTRDLTFCCAAGANAYHVKPVRYPDHLQLVIDILTYWLERVTLTYREERRHG